MEHTTVTLAATPAIDKIISENGVLLESRAGGPFFFISNVFREEQVSFAPIPTPAFEVEILVRKDGEFGRIPDRPAQAAPVFAKLRSPVLMISTILDEISLEGLELYRGKVFLDVQGYVRDGSNFGAKRFFNILSSGAASSIFCLKGTSEELRYLPPDFFEGQKKKLLLETRGKEGCVLHTSGTSHLIRPDIIATPKNSIGAGDTFFAYFLCSLLRSDEPIESARYAARKTTAFLNTKGT